jgi:rhodanese-related sulfurtransferase
MSFLFWRSNVRDLTPEEVANGLKGGKVVLIDVREPNETAVERIPGSVLMPLSRFNPGGLPKPNGRAVVFSCARGNRSRRAATIAEAAGFGEAQHLAGGLNAWKQAGYPTEQS